MDRYTKCVLTVIAAALVALAVGSISRTPAVVAQGRACGDRINPCMVRVVEERAASVTINDPRDCGNDLHPKTFSHSYTQNALLSLSDD